MAALVHHALAACLYFVTVALASQIADFTRQVSLIGQIKNTCSHGSSLAFTVKINSPDSRLQAQAQCTHI